MEGSARCTMYLSHLCHPLVGVVRRGKGAAPLVSGIVGLARALQGDGRGTNGRHVRAVNREWVVGLVLSARALLLVVLVGVLGVGLG